MGRRIEWTDEELAAAVGASGSWRAVAAALGMARGSTHRVKQRAHELGLDTAHMVGNRRWSRAELASAIEGASCWGEVVTCLGTVPENLGRIRGAAYRAGIPAGHLDRTGGERQRDSLRPDSLRLPVAAEHLAAAWFVMAGRAVAMPSHHARFDLVVSHGSTHRRVQVKSTTHRDTDGRWVVVVARRPYSHERMSGREPYDHDDIDDFFVINGAGECYLIPIDAIAGRISIVLDSHPEYRLGTVSDLFDNPQRDPVDLAGAANVRLA